MGNMGNVNINYGINDNVEVYNDANGIRNLYSITLDEASFLERECNIYTIHDFYAISEMNCKRFCSIFGSWRHADLRVKAEEQLNINE